MFAHIATRAPLRAPGHHGSDRRDRGAARGAAGPGRRRARHSRRAERRATFGAADVRKALTRASDRHPAPGTVDSLAVSVRSELACSIASRITSTTAWG